MDDVEQCERFLFYVVWTWNQQGLKSIIFNLTINIFLELVFITRIILMQINIIVRKIYN